MYTEGVSFEWDEASKAGINFRRHGVGATGRLLVVPYTWRGEKIRSIFARRADKHEREEYEAES